MDVWGWICDLHGSQEWLEGRRSPALELSRQTGSAIQLKTERCPKSDTVIFTLLLSGFDPPNTRKHIWVSEACPLSEKQGQYGRFLPLFLQLLQEIFPPSHKLIKPEPIIRLIDSNSHESFSALFNLVFITRMFCICVLDSPADVGSLYFHGVLGPNMELISSFPHAPILKQFLLLIGMDAELSFMRAWGYMLTKWLIWKEISGRVSSIKSPNFVGFSYATESCNMWVLKGYAPICAMKLMCSKNHYQLPAFLDPVGTALRYVLAHQQLEAVIQLEYSVTFFDSFIQVNARIDNIRLKLIKLSLGDNDNESDRSNEHHFPSRLRVWVGLEVGATYVAALSLSKSSEKDARSTECRKTLKATFGKTEVACAPTIKAKIRTRARTRSEAWRWCQVADGNAAVFDAVLCDGESGREVGAGGLGDGGGLLLAGDECGDGVRWRLQREKIESSVLTWRIGGQIWLDYCPSKVESAHSETRFVEWSDVVDLPLSHNKTVI